MGTVPYVYISYDLIAIFFQFFFIFFFHFFHNFLLLFIIMFAKIALIVGLMICASINTEAKRRLPAPVSLNEKYLIRIIDWKLDRIPKTIAILKKRYPEYDGSWEEVEAEIRAEYNSLKKKKPTTVGQLHTLKDEFWEKIRKMLGGKKFTRKLLL